MPLPELDDDFLTAKGFNFEVKEEGGFLHLVLHAYPMPGAYKPGVVDLLLRLPAGYPNAKPDMFWTRPNVTLASGAIPTTANVQETYLGLPWQRWSRHGNGWRPGVDGLRSFLATIRRELEKGI